MLFLIVCILGLGGLAVTLRAGVGKGASPLGLNLIFRASASFMIAGTCATTLAWRDIPPALAQTGWLLLFGAISFWFAGYAAIKAIQLGHLGISWTVLRCAMLMPTLTSLFIWREIPLLPIRPLVILRVVGVVTTTAALVMMGYDRARSRPRGDAEKQDSSLGPWLFWLTLAFLSQGTWETCTAATRFLPSDACRTVFLAVAVVSSFLFTVPLVIASRSRLGLPELGFGVLAGFLGLLGSAGRIWAVKSLGGFIVFPVSTVAVVFFVQLAGVAVWKERMGRWGYAGFMIALAGVLCMSLNL